MSSSPSCLKHENVPCCFRLLTSFPLVTFLCFVFALTGSKHRHVTGHEKNHRPSWNRPHRRDDLQKGENRDSGLFLPNQAFFFFLPDSWFLIGLLSYLVYAVVERTYLLCYLVESYLWHWLELCISGRLAEKEIPNQGGGSIWERKYSDYLRFKSNMFKANPGKKLFFCKGATTCSHHRHDCFPRLMSVQDKSIQNKLE